MRARLRLGDPADARAAAALLVAAGYRVLGQTDPAPADLLVVDEWTPEDAPSVQAARLVGTRVTVLAELVLAGAPRPLVAVTGTAGKTSTCRALEDILRASGHEVVISSTARANNAWPDHSLAGPAHAGAVTVAEMTSTHLCHMGSVHPDVAVITMIRPDHVEMHGSLDRYLAAKRKVVAHLIPGDAVVLPVDDPETCVALGPITAAVWGFGVSHSARQPGAFAVGGQVVLDDGRAREYCPAPASGPALRAALAAGAAALSLGLAPTDVAHAMSSIRPVPHRIHRLVGPGGVTLVDDTMAATPLKALAAITEFGTRDLVLVVGGDDAPAGVRVHAAPEEEAVLARALGAARDAARLLVAFGPASDRVRAHVRPDVVTNDINEAMDVALGAAASTGAHVLVSPMFPLTTQDRDHVASLGTAS